MQATTITRLVLARYAVRALGSMFGVLAIGGLAKAQDLQSSTAGERPKGGLDIVPALVVPVGTLSDKAGLGAGIFLGGEYGIARRLSLTARVGFVHHLGKEWSDRASRLSTERTHQQISTSIGLRGYFTSSFYAGAELGGTYDMVHVRETSAGVRDPISTSATDFGATAALGVGYRFADLDAGVRGSLLSLEAPAKHVALMASLAYRFWQ